MRWYVLGLVLRLIFSNMIIMKKPLLLTVMMAGLTHLSTAALLAPYSFPDGNYPTTGTGGPNVLGDWIMTYASNPIGANSHLFVGPSAGHPDNIAFEVFGTPVVDPSLMVTITTVAQQSGNFGFRVFPLFNTYLNLDFLVNGSPTPISLSGSPGHLIPVSDGDVIGFRFTNTPGIPTQSQITLGDIGFVVVPESSSWALFAGSAVAGLALLRRTRKDF